MSVLWSRSPSEALDSRAHGGKWISGGFDKQQCGARCPTDDPDERIAALSGCCQYGQRYRSRLLMVTSFLQT
jgi:hypothetical protein